MSGKERSSKIIRHGFLLYLVCCALICLVLLEFFVRLRIKHQYGFKGGSISELYRYDERTGLRILRRNVEIEGTKTHIRINSLGFRGRELAVQKSANTIRIAALGASTTFCAEVSDDQHTWPELLCKKLSERYPSGRFEVINGGVSGYGIESSFKNLRYRVIRLHPDIVIVYHATNDIAYESRQAAIASGLLKDEDTHYGAPLASFLSTYSEAFNLLYKNITIYLRQKAMSSSHKLKKFPTSYTSPFVAYLDSIYAECQKIDAPLLLLTFSTQFRRDQPLKKRIANMNTAFYYMPWMTPNAILDAFDSFNREIADFAKRRRNVYVDTLHNSIPGDDKHFVDSVHFTDEGCQVMAERVCNALIRLRILEHLSGRIAAVSR